MYPTVSGGQESSTDEINGVIAAGQQQLPTRVFRHECQEVCKRITSGFFEEPFDAFY